MNEKFSAFLEGFTNAFNLFPEIDADVTNFESKLKSVRSCENLASQVEDALKNDWIKIGKDMEKAIGNYERSLKNQDN